LGGYGQSAPGDWVRMLRDHISDRLSQFNTRPHADEMRRTLNAWHLELLGRPEHVVFYFEWPENGVPALKHSAMPPEERGYGIICHGPDLVQVAKGTLNLEAISLGGLFRYRSPESDGKLEQLRGRVLRPLDWLFGA